MASVTEQTDVFTQYRPLLFGIAYRMLGSVQDAEDTVQDTYLRWQQAAPDDVRAPKSYLSTIVSRLCIDRLRSAKQQREQYIGPWLPEPLLTEETIAMDDKLALADSLSMAFLVLLERLSPVERAVFLLREVFDYEYPEIARIVDKSEANCRQMAHRARQHVASGGRRYDPPPELVAQVAQRFLQVTANGDVEGLIELLDDNVTVWSDGGGKAPAALNPIYGPAKVARFFIGLGSKMPPSTTLRPARVNGGPGFVAYIDGEVYFVAEVAFAEGKVQGIRIVRNPDKLRHVPSLN